MTAAQLEASSPEPLAEHHIVEGFDSGEPSLDRWLVRQAKLNQISGASRTFVLIRDGKVAAYYALAAGAIASDEAPGRLRRNMPNPIPVFVLGRLAVDGSWQGRGLGSLMLRDAFLRTMAAAKLGGIVGVLVHALPQEAATFYRERGFVPSPSSPLTLVARMKDVEALIGQASR